MLENGSPPTIRLRGVAVHNLKQVDLDLPHRQWIAFCGVSGSGKTSLALDTLYAEGQRRYVESFSLYTRQFLQRLDKPEAERVGGIPASIAVTRDDVSRSNRATSGTATEIVDYLRLLFAKIGRLVCPQCGIAVERFSPQAAAERLGVDIEGASVVGDSVWDMLAARRAHALGIGLLSGGYGMDELERAGAYRVYEDPADMLKHLDDVGGRR